MTALMRLRYLGFLLMALLAAGGCAAPTIQGLAPSTATPVSSVAGVASRILRDEVIAAPYYWVVDGERVDRWPQLSPDGSKVVYLPTVDGKATDLDRLVVRDLATGVPDGPARLWVVRRDGSGLGEVTTEPYELVQGGGLLWADGGRAYFNGLPGDARNQVDGHQYELDAQSGVARMVSADWRMHNLVSVSRDGRRLLVIRGGWDKAEIHLLELEPPAAALTTGPRDRDSSL